MEPGAMPASLKAKMMVFEFGVGQYTHIVWESTMLVLFDPTLWIGTTMLAGLAPKNCNSEYPPWMVSMDPAAVLSEHTMSIMSSLSYE